MKLLAVTTGLIVAMGSQAAQPATASTTADTVEGWRTAGSLAVGAAAYPVPSGAYFVSPLGDDSARGTLAAPWRTVARAVRAVPAGGVVVLRAGIYHESVQVYGKRVTLQAYPRERVWFDGTESVTGWVQDGTAWRKDGWTTRFDHTDPTSGGGDAWRMVGPDNPVANWPDQMFVDGQQQTQVASRDQLRPGTFFVDYAGSRLYVGSDPAGHDVRATTLAEALYLNHANGSSVLGIGFRRYATPIRRMGAVKGYADDLLFENDVFADTALAGLSINGQRITVRHNTFLRNGQLGLHGHHADRATVIGNLMQGNNWEHFETAPVSGGVKITTSTGLRVVANRSERNFGPGIWLDESVSDSVVARNLAYANLGHGIHYEISARGLIAGNIAADNGGNGLYVNEASDVRLWNNTAVRNGGAQIGVIDGARQNADPRMPWNVSGVEVSNNLLQGRAGAGVPQVSVEDLTGRRTAAQMAVLNHDVYYRPAGGSGPLITWVNRRAGQRSFTNLPTIRESAHMELNGQEIRGVVPFAQSGVFRIEAELPGGAPLPADVATWMNAAPGSVIAVGALT
ncbi:right-handed parallel beta-helix repeat-containing protein [Microbispora sp. NPDC049125]|uniref:right-handed parallel beta-helix repeat-containing protein n=1 Tax=Microbispora sp. NPDC049125 TaxID=3154929 RepID=UPI00346599D2